MRNQLVTIERLRVLQQIADFDQPWEELAVGSLTEIFAFEFGRRWYEIVRGSIAPDVVVIADHILESGLYTDCGTFFELLTPEPVSNTIPEAKKMLE